MELLQPITCRAAVQWEPKQSLVIETIEVAPPKAGEVRIKVFANGACHSDQWVMEGKSWDSRMQWPMILGHEGAGIVESVGEGVTTVQPGDHVIPLYQQQCKDCVLCKSPKTNLCCKYSESMGRGTMPDGTTRFTCRGKTVYHFMGVSAFSEYTVVTEICVCKIDPVAPLDRVCLLGCGVATGYGAALKTANVDAGSTCAVWGLGAIGLAAVMGCKAAGAKRIIGIDINPSKFEIAKKFGATDFVNPNDHKDPIESVIIEQTGGGCDFTLECIGNIATMKAAFLSCHMGWGVATLVGCVPAGQELSASPSAFTGGGRVLKGSSFGGWKSRDDVPKLVDLYMKKELMVDEFVTHEMELDRVNEAFNLLLAGKSIRTIVKIQ